MAELPETPLLDELEKGPWPSFVTEIKEAAVVELSNALRHKALLVGTDGGL